MARSTSFMAAGWRPAVILAMTALVCAVARADAGWFESGDTLLRNDLLLLNDAGIIRLPVNHWPLPRAAVRHAVENGSPHYANNAAVAAALARVRARIDSTQRTTGSPLSLGTSASIGEPGLLRDFDATARESAEVGAKAGYSFGDRAEIALNVTGVADPIDDRSVRLDGSHASLQLGNWLLSANTLDRWWGPGHEGSLILSNNARPMPTVMIERATAQAFDSRWLNWLGPWRFNFGISRMEGERQDIDAPLFMAWRVTIMPFKDIELGFSRTAQFCGDQLECSWNVFWNMIAGNDNLGIDATAENEPGNQMAGFDIRWNSPIGNLPYAIYSQMIGEDESSYVPAKYLAQFGVEVWRPMADGGLLQAHIEYSTTTCSANTGRGPYYNCAYNQGLFNAEGYRYHGRVVGYTADRDAENYSIGATLTTPGGELWTATARTSRLNRDDYGDVRNTVAPLPTDYLALEFGWRGRLFGEHIDIDLGVESIEPEGGERNVEPFGFIRWNHAFVP